MPSTYSPSLRIELIGAGEQAGTWNTTTNTNLGTLLDTAIAGNVAVSVTSANQALTANNGATDQARQAILTLSTTTAAAFAIYAPPQPKEYIVNNTSAYAATIYNSTVLGNTTAAGTGVAVAAGNKIIVFSDGTNFSTISLPSPGTGTVTQVNTGGGSINGLSLTGGPITTTGTISLTGTLSGTASGLSIGGNAATATTATTASSATQLNTGSWLGYQSGVTLAYSYLGTPKATLDTTGNWAVNGYLYGNELFINTFSSLGGYAAKCNILYNSSSQAGIVTQAQTATSNNAMVFLNNAGTAVGSIFVTSTNTTFNDLSDYRLKNSITPMTGALAKVALLKPCTYKWNYDNSDSQGFIAHELQAVVPECVTGEKDALNENGSIKAQGIDTSKLVATLTAAIQELKALVDVQAARITALESR